MKFDCPCCQKHCDIKYFPATCSSCGAILQLCVTDSEADGMLIDNEYAAKTEIMTTNGFVVGICNKKRLARNHPRKVNKAD